jgi:tetratricopeptide (TPR) repeat protein
MMDLLRTRPTDVEVQTQVARLKGSFARKQTLITLLEFLVEKSLKGHTDDLSETRIAQDVFGKKEEFEGADNSIVRTNAARLRKELQAYYRYKGRLDPVVLALPRSVRSGYILRITKRITTDNRHSSSPTALSRRVRSLCKEGWHNLDRRVGEALWRALSFFEQAVELDPTNEEAHSGIADCCVILNTTGEMSGLEGQQRAETALGPALLLNRKSSKSLASAAAVHGMFRWQWERSESEFRRALRLKATAKIHFDFASFCLLPMGKLIEAEEQIERALDLEPNSPRIMLHKAIILYARQSYAEAIKECLDAIKMHADFGGHQFWLARVYTACGEYNRALASFAESWERAPLIGLKGHVAYCHGRIGNVGHAEAILHELQVHRVDHYVPPHAFALAHIGLNQTDAGFGWLERAVDAYDVWAPLLLNVDPLLEGLRSNPRTLRLLRRMRLRE